MTYWIISNEDDEDLFWSNEQGWVPLEIATHFTHTETKTLNLPLGGRWMPVEMDPDDVSLATVSIELSDGTEASIVVEDDIAENIADAIERMLGIRMNLRA